MTMCQTCDHTRAVLTAAGVEFDTLTVVDAIEELIRAAVPAAVIQRGVDLIPEHEVTPDLMVNGAVGVWVPHHWKDADRDALVLSLNGKSVAALAVVEDDAEVTPLSDIQVFTPQRLGELVERVREVLTD